jgi:hypothetical protein
MKVNIPFPLRVLLVFIVAGLYAYLLLDDHLNWLYPIIIYPVALVIGLLVGGLSYGVLPGKKAIVAAKEHLKYTTSTQANASTPRSRAIGYGIWLACCAAGALLMAIGKIVLE